MSQNSKSFWDKTWTKENDRFYPHFFNIASLLPREGKLLDVGCGTGTLLHFLRDRLPDLKLEGRDHSDVAIQKLRKRGIKGKVEKLPTITGKYDIIVACEVLEHMKDDEKVFRNMAQVANRIIVTVPNNRLGPEECGEHERKYTTDSLGKVIEKYFDKYDIYDTGLYLLADAWKIKKEEVKTNGIEQQKIDVDYIITGTPRSGTQYMAELFTSAGINCGHEMFYGMPGIGKYKNNVSAEASWLIAPALDKQKAKIIHVVRDPLKTIQSIVNRKFFNEDRNIYRYYINTFLNSPHGGLDWAIDFYVSWNEFIEQYADHRIKVEEISDNPAKFFADIGVNIKNKSKLCTKKTVNASKSKQVKITKKDIDNSSLAKLFYRIANKYGYKY